jgi:nucleoside-diphosphate-sugar epimerase
MKMLITGGAGYLGSIMTPYFLSSGYEVTVLDSLMYRQVPLLDCCADSNFDFVKGDCRDEGLIKDLLRDADIIIPLAALVGAPLCDQDRTAAVTVNRDAMAMIDRLRSCDQMLLIPITNSGYGIGEKDTFCTEESSLRPVSLYGRTKVEAEAGVLENGEAISFRLATVFGCSPRMRTDLLVNDFVYRAIHDRTVVLFESQFKRNYIHIRDVARVFAHGIENYTSMKGHPYNVGLSDANLSKAELCAKIKTHLPEFVYFESAIGEDPDKRDYIVSNERIEGTGWRPAYSLDDGIRELIKAYRIIKNNQYANV